MKMKADVLWMLVCVVASCCTGTSAFWAGKWQQGGGGGGGNGRHHGAQYYVSYWQNNGWGGWSNRPGGYQQLWVAATILEALEANPSTQLLAAALKAFPETFLKAATTSTTQFTVFAPTDAAIRSAMIALDIDRLDNRSRALGPPVLSYHIATTPLFASQLRQNASLPTLRSNSFLAVDLRVGKLPVIRGVNSAANIIYTNIKAGQSVIHLIDKVLFPFNPFPVPFDNIVSAAAASNLDSLVAAATKAGLADTLANPELVATVFAPTDAAFDAALDSLGFTLDTVPVDTLTKILQYHVVPAYRPIASIVAETRAGTLLGQFLRFSYPFYSYRRWHWYKSSAPKLLVKAFGSTGGVVVPDVFAGKAVVHVVDAVLIPDLS